LTDDHKSNALGRFLTGISMLSFRNPFLTLLLSGLLCAFSVWLASARLELRMDWTYLFYPDEPIVVAGQHARSLFPLPGDIAVLVDQGTLEDRKEFLDRLASRMEEEPDTFKHIFYRFDLKPLMPKALYYLDEKTLAQLANGLDAAYEGSPGGAPTGTGRKIFLKLLGDLDQALRTRGRATYTPIWQMLAEDQNSDTANYVASLMKQERYIYPTVGDGKVNVLISKAGDLGDTFANSGPLIVRLRQILKELNPTVKGLRIRMTGLPVMLFDERETCSTDGTRSSIISMVLCVILFIMGFGEIGRPLLGCLALAVGMAWTMGYTTVTVGHLNFITVTLASLLMGLGIDFGIHFVFRYDEEMSKGATPEQAIEKTCAGTGVDTCVGALATAAAFLALAMAHFRGITDFGVIAAGGTMLCYLSTIVVLPALLAVFPGKPRGTAGQSKAVLLTEKLILDNAGKITILGMLFVAAAAFWTSKVKFSYNLLEVQAQEISTVRTEREMIQETKSTVLSAEAHDKGEAEARRKMKAYEALPTVARVGSILSMLPERSPEKQALIERITGRIAQLQLPARVNLESADDLLAVQQRVRELEASMPKGNQDPEVAKAIEALKAEVKRMDPGPIQDGLSIFQDEVRGDLKETLAVMKMQVAVPPTLADLPSELRLRYVNKDGWYRQTVQPNKNIWQRENLEPFLRDVKSVDPGIMGHPVVQEQILSAFARTLARTPWYTLAGVLLVLALYLRSPLAITMSLLPTAVGVVVMFGTMGYLNMSFNVVNFVGLPISVGLGAVYGVHALHRMRELNDETLLSSSTGPAILLSGLTTVVGLGSLMVAHHRGIYSLGFVTAVGVAVNFVGSLVFLPALHRVLRLRGRSPEQAAALRAARQARQAPAEASDDDAPLKAASS
jgi:hopanoid biosynthesis associated RND transporter like protein HpnN